MSPSLREQLHEAAMHVHPLGDIDKAISSGVQGRNRRLAVVSAVGVTCVVVLAAVIFVALPGDSQPEPLRPPTPSPSHASRVFGWPDISRNAPGVYSRDGDRCGAAVPGDFCRVGFMHNGYGSGDVEINIRFGATATNPEVGATATDPEDSVSADIAGHDGIYRSINDHYEQWIFEIEEFPITIELKTEPDTSPTDLAEAHAIIDSMYTESTDNPYGFRVVFTLTTNDWDSG